MAFKVFSKHGIRFNLFKPDNVWYKPEHESTQQIVDFLFRQDLTGKSVLDIGTGTGFLSILCGKLGATKITAIDCDPEAVKTAKNNLKMNEVQAEVIENNLTDGLDIKADVVIANLPSAPQLENLAYVSNHVKDGGIFVLTWWNILPFGRYFRGYEVVDFIRGDEFDGYVLKKER